MIPSFGTRFYPEVARFLESTKKKLIQKQISTTFWIQQPKRDLESHIKDHRFSKIQAQIRKKSIDNTHMHEAQAEVGEAARAAVGRSCGRRAGAGEAPRASRARL